MSFTVAAIVGAGVGLTKLGISLSGRKKRIEEQKKAKAEMAQKKKAYEALDTSNVYKNMENKMEDLTINQKGMQAQMQQGQQSRADTMQKLKGAAGSSGIAALAQQMANQGQLSAQQAGKEIGDQEAANQAKAAAEASKIQDAKIAGPEKSRSLQYKKTGNQLAAASGEYAAAGAAKDQASRDQMSAVGSIASSVIGG